MKTEKEKEYLDRIAELEKELKRTHHKIKKDTYGLHWLDVPEAFEDDVENKLPILKEVRDKAIVNEDGKPTHILIEGDNYHALTCLNYTHKGKIDVIYIDPPYNTGSDGFRYKDKRFLTEFPDGTEVPTDHPLRHSYWLSFIKKRIELSKDLLKDDGVLFISIGDDEIAQLSMLCEHLFGANNKLGIIARVAKTAGDRGSYFAPSKDYVLCFAKNKELLSDFKDEVDKSLFKKAEKNGPFKGEKYRDDVAFYQSSLDPMRGCKNQRYFVECPDGSFVIPPGNNLPSQITDASNIEPQTADDKVWRWSYESYLEQKHLLVFKKSNKTPLLDENGNQGKYNIYTKSYLKERSKKGKSPRDYIDKFYNRKGADLIKQYDIDFAYSKPVELIEHLIKITNKSNNIIVLDFFAGSATTLHSTLVLNEKDNGNRQCIISTNNENNICENVTYPRCDRIINKYVNKKGKEMPYYPGNGLKHFKTEFIGKNNILSANDSDKTELAHHAGEMLAIAENTLYEMGEYQTDFFQFFQNEKHYTAIYFREELKQFEKFRKKVIALEKPVTVYVFSWGENEFADQFDDRDDIEVKPIPQPILEVYKTIYNLSD